MVRWVDYLRFLDGGPYSTQLLISSLEPSSFIEAFKGVWIRKLNYKLWPFQERILRDIAEDTLILGLPTGLGKTYLAGAYLKDSSADGPISVLFLVPSIPLGVQQTLFARRMLNVDEAYFISGSLTPERRRALGVWKAGFVVSTPQTFYNDVLSPFSISFEEARRVEDPVGFLAKVFKGVGFSFPYKVVVADECQQYIGETDGYSILLAAKAAGVKILALSATPQLHAPKRLEELKKVFSQIKVFSVNEPEIRRHMPERVLVVVKVYAPRSLIAVYNQLGKIVQEYLRRVGEAYGPSHPKAYCKSHSLCVLLTALRMLRFRLVEDGASSVLKYKVWRCRDLHKPVEELEGLSVYEAYMKSLKESFNHKIFMAIRVLNQEVYGKAIVFTESVQAARQLGAMLQDRFGVEDVAILVGKQNMSLEQQASSLMHFKERARVLVSTSVGEEGLDIPSADMELWLDPPSSPKKWIQRFGRILRQPGDKKRALTYALISMRTHEGRKLLGVRRKVEEVYGFTQKLSFKPLPRPLPKGQETLTKFLKS